MGMTERLRTHNEDVKSCNCIETIIGSTLNRHIISKIPKYIRKRSGFDWQSLVLPIILKKRHNLLKISLSRKLLQKQPRKISPLLTCHEKECVKSAYRFKI